MKIIMGGHWAEAPEGWTALTERDQDITKPLNYADGTVDVIFTEHVIEHVDLAGGVAFMREAFRVLKPGGVFRVVAPMIDTLIKFQTNEFGRRYANETLLGYYLEEHSVLENLGLGGLEYDAHPFIMDSLFKKHGHQFIWTEKLMCAVLAKVGFRDVRIAEPGVSFFNGSSAIERTMRGSYSIEPDFGPTVYDPESGVVEAKK